LVDIDLGINGIILNRMNMEEKKEYIKLEDLEVYKLARELSKMGWAIYSKMTWQTRKIIGDQFIESIDSIGANIAESYGLIIWIESDFCTIAVARCWKPSIIG
jgi:hypothetical protein